MLSIEQINNLEAENQKCREAYTKLNNLYKENCEYTGRLENALQTIEGLCKETTANVKRYGFERDYNYKAIVQHNNKILKVIRKVSI